MPDSGLDTYMKAYAFSQEAALGEMSPFVTSWQPTGNQFSVISLHFLRSFPP